MAAWHEQPSRRRAGRGASELVVFGRRAVLEALASDSVEVLEVRVARRVGGDFRRLLAAACRRRGLTPETERSQAVSAFSGEPRHDQGVAARIRLLALMETEAFVAGLTGKGARRPVRVLALDGVTNSQNIGMIVRSLVASGVHAMLWPLVGSPWINGLVVKSAAATLYACPIVRCETLIQGLSDLRAAGFRCIGLSAQQGTSLRDYAPPHRAVFVVGGETTGIDAEVAGLIDDWVRIPLQGGVESLNVAVAASLLCFHLGVDPADSSAGRSAG